MNKDSEKEGKNINDIKDEDKMIKKLEEHRDLVDLAVAVGKKECIHVERTKNNNPKGDFWTNNLPKLVAALDNILPGKKI